MIDLVGQLAAALVAIALAVSAPAEQESTDHAPETAPVPIRFAGRLPGAVDDELEGTFEVTFRLYRSPTGGRAVWSETRRVGVERGRIDLRLGTKTSIPDGLHEENFKWLGASVDGGREVYPRFHVVNVVYASPGQPLLPAPEKEVEREPLAPRSRLSGRSPTTSTWRRALARARELGGSLPEFDAWYDELSAAGPDQRTDRVGHYEWVMPWAYDTASNGRYNAFFRGRFEGCDYSDLSPAREYFYRVSLPLQPREASDR